MPVSWSTSLLNFDDFLSNGVVQRRFPAVGAPISVGTLPLVEKSVLTSARPDEDPALPRLSPGYYGKVAPVPRVPVGPPSLMRRKLPKEPSCYPRFPDQKDHFLMLTRDLRRTTRAD